LLADGSSDRALLPVITWLLREKLPSRAITLDWADLRRLPRVSSSLTARIQAAVEYYPCDLLFVHRDAEKESREKRVEEVQEAAQSLSLSSPYVCVVPVRMQEAWMLIEEKAIRCASGNPNGAIAIVLPRIQHLENLSDPKDTLHDLLRTASELKGRRLKQFTASANAHRVAELIENWQPLRRLSAFIQFEQDLDQALLILGQAG
jgi:hypothetical protein